MTENAVTEDAATADEPGLSTADEPGAAAGPATATETGTAQEPAALADPAGETAPATVADPETEAGPQTEAEAGAEADPGTATEPGGDWKPDRGSSRLARHSRGVPGSPISPAAVVSRISRTAVVSQLSRAAAASRLPRAVAVLIPAGAGTSGQGFARLTLLPVLLVIAWLLPAVPLLLAGSFSLAPMLVISIPLALVLIVTCLASVPGRWPKSAQARPGLGSRAPWWSLAGTVAVAAGFAAWQMLESSQQVVVASDPGTSLQLGYWIAQHGSVSIPVSASAFGGMHPGLAFSSVGFAQHGASLSPQFLAGLPSLLAAGFWAGGIHAALLVPAVLGALAVLTFAGLVGRLAGPRWAPAGAVVLAFALPEQYTSRAAFSETLVQVLLFGGLCLFIDALGAPVVPQGRGAPWWRTSPGPGTMLAALGGLALGLAAVVRVDGLTDVLPAIPVIGIMIAARKPQWLPFSAGLAVGVGYGLAAGYVLARPYLDTLSSWMRTFGIIACVVTVITVGGVLLAHYGQMLLTRYWTATRYWPAWPGARRILAARPLRWLPEAAAALTVLALFGFAIRPYVQTVRANSGPSVVAYVGYLQRLAGLPLDPRRLYAEDTLYWVIWYIGLPALLLGVCGLALVARRVARALITWRDPDSAARIWALPLLMVGWALVTVLWRPGTVPDQPWASRRLVPLVLPGLILAAVWAAAWLTGRARLRGAGKTAASAVAALSTGALLLPTALTTFGVGVSSSGGSQPAASTAGLAFQRTGHGELAAVDRLCAAIGADASVVILDPRIADGFSQLIRGGCDTPTARAKPVPFNVVPVVAAIERAHRHPVLLGSTQAQISFYGGVPREVVNLTTSQDAHELTRPPTTTWPIGYKIWMTTPGGG